MKNIFINKLKYLNFTLKNNEAEKVYKNLKVKFVF